MSNLKIKAEKRKIQGRKVKKLREQGILPANIYGNKIKSQAIKVKKSDFSDIFKQAGETGLIDLMLAGKKRPALIHNVQVDPVSDEVLHADFLQVDLKKKVTAQVPIYVVGESPAEKEGGTVVQLIDEIEVEALPKNLPEKFEVSATSLKEIDSTFSVSDIKVDKSKIEIKNDPEQMIVKVEPPREEEEVVEEIKEEEAEGEAVSEEQEVPVEKKDITEEQKEEKKEKEPSKESPSGKS